jgi:DNA-binding XRE family transcriptional regulator
MKEGAVMSNLDAEIKGAGVKFDDIKAQLMEDAAFEEEYNKLQPRYELISQIIEARKSMKMTQEELARRAGTRKSNISRLESGSYNPSLDFLIKIAKGLGKDIHIEIR